MLHRDVCFWDTPVAEHSRIDSGHLNPPLSDGTGCNRFPSSPAHSRARWPCRGSDCAESRRLCLKLLLG